MIYFNQVIRDYSIRISDNDVVLMCVASQTIEKEEDGLQTSSVREFCPVAVEPINVRRAHA